MLELEWAKVSIPLAWRIQSAEPSGLTMWFDPTREQPLLGVQPPAQRERGSGLETQCGTLDLLEGVPLEGGADRVIVERPLNSLPEPPEGFLNELWEGDWDHGEIG